MLTLFDMCNDYLLWITVLLQNLYLFAFQFSNWVEIVVWKKWRRDMSKTLFEELSVLLCKILLLNLFSKSSSLFWIVHHSPWENHLNEITMNVFESWQISLFFTVFFNSWSCQFDMRTSLLTGEPGDLCQNWGFPGGIGDLAGQSSTSSCYYTCVLW